jgi:hypothetical protein
MDNLKTSVSFAMTVNLGNYNNVKLGVVIEDHMQNVDEFDEKYKQLYAKASTKVLDTLRLLKEKSSE